jgi:hypothetical protein
VNPVLDRPNSLDAKYFKIQYNIQNRNFGQLQLPAGFQQQLWYRFVLTNGDVIQ